MAPFNPSIPETKDPYYLGLSKEITQPKYVVDESAKIQGEAERLRGRAKGIELSALGTAIQGAVGIADTYFKDKATEDVRVGVDTLSGINMAGLETVTGRESPSLTQDVSSNQPLEIRSAGTKAALMRTAADSGKISLTDYYGKLYALQRQLRAAYPGYIDFVDAQVSKAAGVNPANAYRRSMLSDYNAAMATSQDTYNKLRSDGLKYAPQYLQKWENGEISTDFFKKEIYNSAAFEVRHRHKQYELDNIKGDNELKEKSAQDLVELNVGQSVRNVVVGMEADLGAGLGKMTLFDYLTGIEAGTIPKPTQPQAEAILAKFQAKANLESFNLVKNLTESGVYKHMDESKINNSIEHLYTNTLNRLFATFKDEKYGLLGWQTRLIKDIGASVGTQMLEHPELGAYLAIMAGADAVSNGNQIFSASLDNAIFRNGLKGGTDFQAGADRFVGRFVQDHQLGYQQAIPVQNSDGTWRMRPQLRTMKEDVQKNIDMGNRVNQIYKAYVDQPGIVLTDPKITDQAKINAVYYHYHPNNISVLKLVSPDIQAFTAMSSGEIAKSVKELADRTGRNELWTMYTNWVQTEFNTQVFARDIEALSRFADDPRMDVIYTDKDHSFRAEIVPGSSPTSGIAKYATASQVDQANQYFKRLNQGIKGIVHIAEQDSKDETAVEAYLFGMFDQLNLNNVKGIPQKMLDAIINSSGTTTESGKTNARVPNNAPLVSPISKANKQNQ